MMARLFGEDWMTTKWRPMMAIVYMIINLCDFIIFPVFWTWMQMKDANGVIAQQWVPMTLSNGGLFHMAFGAVLGVAAFTRGQEKIEKVKNANMDTQ